MSSQKQLIEVSKNFEQKLRAVSSELCSVKIGEPFEDIITKKLQDLTFLNSKLRLLHAKPIASTPQVTSVPKNEDTIKEYGDLATWKVLEQCIVKSLTQSHCTKALITAPDMSLDPELVERKEKIIHCLKEYQEKESQLRQLDAVHRAKQEELVALREQWDGELTELRGIRETANSVDDVENMGPLYLKLRTYVDKLEAMRWLMSKLACARGRSWRAGPHAGPRGPLAASSGPLPGTLRTLALTRTVHTIEMFTSN